MFSDVGRPRHRVHRRRLRHARQQAGEDVTCRWRFSRLISDGAVPGVRRRDVLERHAAEPARRHGQLPDRRRRLPVLLPPRGRAPRTARRLRCRSSPDRRRPAGAALRPRPTIWTPRSAAFSRSSCTDSSGLPTFSDVSTSTTPGSLSRCVDDRCRVLLELLQVRSVDRELDVGVLVAAAADRRDRPHAGAQVRRRELRQDVRRGRRPSPRTDRASRSSIGFSRT